MTDAAFPGGTSVTRLNVYTDAAPDALHGGTPHLHTVSTEAYIVTAGSGELQTIDRAGFHLAPLSAGSVVWFGAGTIHRAINLGGLEVTVIMSNAGLPEAGDAVMTFPASVVTDAARYAEAATLPDTSLDRAAAASAAARRRDLAVEGFEALRDAAVAGDGAALEEFYASAVRLVSARADGWRELWEERVLADVARTRGLLDDLAAGRVAQLGLSGATAAQPHEGEPKFGMCGLLRTYDISV
ncbi:cupin domain-containing protein [Leifsonia sp. Leaf264]|uniref:cupin domain-containing protein n=1 Tax=Leifsonia sp. Leaf264 TaxID=1736314 RepID=UPI0006F97CD6|nr:cupin domain-containing protein [Leifsonia sp. Leaf264]KQO97045.1 cupin [Leifsonia sp. Leaf264]